MRTLFYLYPALLSQGPTFNAAWSQLLLKIMRGLVGAGHDCHMITASRFKEFLQPDVNGLSISYIKELELHKNVIKVDPRFAVPSELSRLVRMVPGEQPAVLDLLLEQILKGNGDFKPEVIITFAMQADYLKILWPNSHIFYAEAGAFSRSPYPFTLFFDHQGTYSHSVAAQLDLANLRVDDSAIQLAKEVNKYAKQTLVENDPFTKFDLRKKFKRLVLFPLQVSNYFSFDDQAPYKTQFEFLLEVLTSAPKDVGIVVTEYVQWGEVLQLEGAGKNLEWFTKAFPNLIFKEEFRKFTSPSQYLLPHVDGLITICSNLGYQALFLEKRLGCSYDSFLKNVSHDYSIQDFFKNLKKVPVDKTIFLAWYIERYAVPEQLFNDGLWFADYIERRIQAIESAVKPEDGFVRIATNDILRTCWLDTLCKDTPTKWETDKLNLYRQLATVESDTAVFRGMVASQRPIITADAKNTNSKYILLNDTRKLENYVHLGCNAVTRLIEERMGLSGLSCLGSANFAEECNALLASIEISHVKLVVLNGEGYVHHDSGRIRDLILFCHEMKKHGVPSVLINTTWHENTATLGQLLNVFDIVAVRDSISLKEIKPWYFDARVIPDISFAAFASTTNFFVGTPNTPANLSKLVVIDHVQNDIAANLAAFAEFHRFPFYLMGPLHIDSLIREVGNNFQIAGVAYPKILQSPAILKNADACVTGRFHGLTAALSIAMPVVAYSSNTPKMAGLLADIGVIDNVLLNSKWISQTRNKQLDSIERLLSTWSNKTHHSVKYFITSAKSQIDILFQDINLLINNYSNECLSLDIEKKCTKPISIGEKRHIDFNQADASAYLVEGFHQPEAWGVWSKGQSAKLMFPVQTNVLPEVSVTVTMLIKIFDGIAGNAPVIQISTNNKAIGYVLFRHLKLNQQEISFTCSTNNESFEIELFVSHSISPFLLNQSDDTRELGFGICALSVSVSPMLVNDVSTVDHTNEIKFWGISPAGDSDIAHLALSSDC